MSCQAYTDFNLLKMRGHERFWDQWLKSSKIESIILIKKLASYDPCLRKETIYYRATITY